MDKLKVILKEPFINQYNMEGINFSSHTNDQTKFETNTQTIPLKILYVLYNSKEIRLAYVSKYNLKHKN